MIGSGTIPDGPMPCPQCGCDVRATLDAGRNRCPECGYRFTDAAVRDLYGRPDPEGAPASLSPHETRVSGKWIILALIILLVLVSVLIAYLISSGANQLMGARAANPPSAASPEGGS